MAGKATLEFTDANFETEVLNSSTPVLVDFWAEWCAPCRALGPTIDELASEYTGKAKVGKLNTDNNGDTAIKYGIQSIPTIMLFQGGDVARKFVGIKSKSDLKAAIDGLLG